MESSVIGANPNPSCAERTRQNRISTPTKPTRSFQLPFVLITALSPSPPDRLNVPNAVAFRAASVPRGRRSPILTMGRPLRSYHSTPISVSPLEAVESKAGTSGFQASARFTGIRALTSSGPLTRGPAISPGERLTSECGETDDFQEGQGPCRRLLQPLSRGIRHISQMPLPWEARSIFSHPSAVLPAVYGVGCLPATGTTKTTLLPLDAGSIRRSISRNRAMQKTGPDSGCPSSAVDRSRPKRASLIPASLAHSA